MVTIGAVRKFSAPYDPSSCAQLAGEEIPFAFNRKEEKDHGEGGNLMGAPLQGKVIILDDVNTAGTSVRESVDIISPTGEIIATQTRRDRTIKRLSIYNDTPLQPGDATTLLVQVFNAREIRLDEYEYRKSGEKQSFAMHCKIRKQRIPFLFLWTISP